MNQFPIRQNPPCTEIQDILEVYLADELDANTHATIEAHIASCPKCQDEVRFVEAISEALQELPRPEPPPKIFNQVSAYVRAHSDTDRKWTDRIFQVFTFRDNLTASLIGVGALVCLVGLLLFGIHGYQHHTRIVQASHDLNYALSKLHYAVERTDFVVGEKLSEMQIDETSRRSFIMIEDASRRVLKQKMNISSAIHRSLDSLNGFPEIINTKYDGHSHQEGDIP
jgi:hypothetical protein